jgi:uncharacterized membrane protein YhiD involved in acid resistance
MNEESNQFLDKLMQPPASEIFGTADIFLAMIVSSLLCFALANVYRYTHRGTSYSQSYLVTLFAMAVCTAVVMMIIGSNIARAFSLVGALSIIRFRTAVKDPRDTGYLFAAMVAGMGCGTGFYLAAISMTGFICALMIALHATDFGLKQRLEQIVRLTYRPGEDTLVKIEAELGQAFREYKLINRILDFGDGAETNVYVVKPGKSTEEREVESRLGAIEGVISMALYESDQHNPF